MKSISNISKLLSSFNKLRNSKIAYRSFQLIAIFTMLLVFTPAFLPGAYAQDEVEVIETINICDVYRAEEQSLYEKLTNISVANTINSALIAGLDQGIGILDPSMTSCDGNTAGGMIEIERPDGTKAMVRTGGLLMIVSQSNDNLIAGYGQVDVVEHLAQEWVPGNTELEFGNSVYAQTPDGYDYLQSMGIADIHLRVRAFSYMAFVLVLIAAGFMIMFRQKIGGQVAITVFNTLPNVVVGLFLVTFSFSIVGVVLDLGGVLMYVVNSLLDIDKDTALYVSNPLSILWYGVKGVAKTGGTALGIGAGTGLITYLTSSVAGLLAGIGYYVSGAAFIASAAILLIVLVFLGIIFWISLKLFKTLLGATVGIVLDTVMAPIFLTIAAIPGNSSVGWGWFNRILKYMLTFVGVHLFVNLAVFIFESNFTFAFPGMLGGEDNLLNSFIFGIMKAVIPLLLLSMAAEVPKFLEDFLPSNGGKGAGAAIQGAMGNLKNIPILGSFVG